MKRPAVFDRLFSIVKRSPVIDDLAAGLRDGALTKIDLNRFGVSELGFRYMGRKFSIGWYSSGCLRDIQLGGNRMFSTSAEALYLLSVAKARADRLFVETVASLERERETTK